MERSSRNKKKKAGGVVGGLCRYKSIAFAVLFTAIITRQLTIISVLQACSENQHLQDRLNAQNNGIIHFTSLEPPASHVKSKPSSANAKAKSTIAAKRNSHSETNIVVAAVTSSSIVEDSYLFETIPSRAWKPFEHDFPCYPPYKDPIMSTKPCHEGILFQRPEKVGSTTLTNVVLRLAFNRGAARAKTTMYPEHYDPVTGSLVKKLSKTQERKIRQKWGHPARCQHRSMHASSVDLDYVHRDRKKSFLFGLARDPTKRILSMYFHFVVTYLQQEPTDANFIEYALRPQSNNRLIRALTLDPDLPKQMSAEFERYLDRRNKNQTTAATATAAQYRKAVPDLVKLSPPAQDLNYAQIVQDILDQYDFIAVTERMDESLVALKLLLGLRVEEILYATVSRSAGSFSNGPKERPCMYLIPAFLTGPMRNFFYTPGRNDVWIESSRGDALLHRAASRSLDRTIDEVFGREHFDRELQEFRNAQAYAAAICSSKPDLVLGLCDESGNSVKGDPTRRTTCYIWSEGCDHKCLNNMVPDPIPPEVLNGTRTFYESYNTSNEI